MWSSAALISAEDQDFSVVERVMVRMFHGQVRRSRGALAADG